MKKIDAVGQACPMPVILTKRALKESNGEAILISVDNEIATQNLAKMAEQLKLSVQVEKINDSLYEVQLSDPNAGNESHSVEHSCASGASRRNSRIIRHKLCRRVEQRLHRQR